MNENRQKILWLSPHPIVPPFQGSPIRTFNLIKNLQSDFDISVVCPPFIPTEAPAALSYLKELCGVSIVWAHRFKLSWRRMTSYLFWYEWLSKQYWSFHPLRQAHLPLYRWHRLLVDYMAACRPRQVILDNVCNIETLRFLKKRFPGVHCVLNAHNVEALNIKRYLAMHEGSLRHSLIIKDQYRRILGVERILRAYVDSVWVCSEKDRRIYSFLNRKHPMPISVISNGVNVVPLPEIGRHGDKSSHTLIFVGALHYPLVQESLMWFYHKVWPLLRDEDSRMGLLVIGLNQGESLQKRFAGDSRVCVVENVKDVASYYRAASVSICPIQSGSGTRIKILEAMSLGVPVVSTSVGCEGLEVTAGTHLLVADAPVDFARAVTRLLRDATLSENMIRNAHALVAERYDWRIISQKAKVALLQY